MFTLSISYWSSFFFVFFSGKKPPAAEPPTGVGGTGGPGPAATAESDVRLMSAPVNPGAIYDVVERYSKTTVQGNKTLEDIVDLIQNNINRTRDRFTIENFRVFCITMRKNWKVTKSDVQLALRLMKLRVGSMSTADAAVFTQHFDGMMASQAFKRL